MKLCNQRVGDLEYFLKCLAYFREYI